MKPHCVFLRKGCILPDGLEPHREPIGGDWMLVEEFAAPLLDKSIRQAGWHFMWIQGSCARRGFGFTRDDAADQALARALSGIASRFNAAELESVSYANYPGFHIANITLQPRQIQQHTSFESFEEKQPEAKTLR